MRLTLRTLLAYLDDVLDPADKEELAKKIESSEFAEDLVHRTKDTMRRLRLSAPQVVGTGWGSIRISVEYWTTPCCRKMGDFERICLESDMHGGGSRCNVVTMVPGQPADIDRQRSSDVYDSVKRPSGSGGGRAHRRRRSGWRSRCRSARRQPPRRAGRQASSRFRVPAGVGLGADCGGAGLAPCCLPGRRCTSCLGSGIVPGEPTATAIVTPDGTLRSRRRILCTCPNGRLRQPQTADTECGDEPVTSGVPDRGRDG
jgi:hypothetical protein